MTAQRPIPTFAFYERLVMRLLFAWLVWRATPDTLIVNGIPSPNGITHLFDLHFLLDPHVFSFARIALGAALILYVLRLVVWLALPVALFVNLAASGITNSQGAIQHAEQIVSLILLAQTVAHSCDSVDGIFVSVSLICRFVAILAILRRAPTRPAVIRSAANPSKRFTKSCQKGCD